MLSLHEENEQQQDDLVFQQDISAGISPIKLSEIPSVRSKRITGFEDARKMGLATMERLSSSTLALRDYV